MLVCALRATNFFSQLCVCVCVCGSVYIYTHTDIIYRVECSELKTAQKLQDKEHAARVSKLEYLLRQKKLDAESRASEIQKLTLTIQALQALSDNASAGRPD
jgi:hypothetical protein